jgi:hypothetical protein
VRAGNLLSQMQLGSLIRTSAALTLDQAIPARDLLQTLLPLIGVIDVSADLGGGPTCGSLNGTTECTRASLLRV